MIPEDDWSQAQQCWEAAELQRQQQQDRERIEQDLRDVIEHAQKLGLPREEVKLLKWGCGV